MQVGWTADGRGGGGASGTFSGQREVGLWGAGGQRRDGGFFIWVRIVTRGVCVAIMGNMCEEKVWVWDGGWDGLVVRL